MSLVKGGKDLQKVLLFVNTLMSIKGIIILIEIIYSVGGKDLQKGLLFVNKNYKIEN